MLDFAKLVDQIKEVGQDSLTESPPRDVLSEAGAAFERALAFPGQFEERMLENKNLVLWPVACEIEPFGSTYKVAKAPSELTVLAVDGSQIMPSHHEVHSCYLLNVGLALISYGVKLAPILTSLPRLHHRPEDLYPLVDRRRMHIDELFVSLERNLYELETLAAYSLTGLERGLPVVACYDGSLIPWSVEKMTPSYQQFFIDRIEKAMRIFKEHSIPLIGYISHSRSSEAVNMLRTLVCPYERSDCQNHCGHLNEEDFPCSSIWPLTDRVLFQTKLNKFQRSNIFASAAKMSRALSIDSQVCFTYVNMGLEVARLEFPHFMVDKPEALELGIAALASQVIKGQGYPLALGEAHHLAVIKGTDRERFFQLMTRHLVSMGMYKVRVSPKEHNKRMGFV
ncbi:MAG: DNA double-strand break repair nuclease NurA [Candidatus Obscuribacterales bacterium]|nr:DNA double-strand break repair nuclease NurA [Candidatus Obscuribacterales bacterium]